MSLSKYTVLMLLATVVVTPGHSQSGKRERDILTFLHIDGINNEIDTVYKTEAKHDSAGPEVILCYGLAESVGQVPICYRLPQPGAEVDHVKYVSSRSLAYQGRPVEIRKYLYDDPNIADEEEIYFYSKDLGFLIMKSGSWEGYQRLIQVPDRAQSGLIFYLCESIITDEVFFSKWRE